MSKPSPTVNIFYLLSFNSILIYTLMKPVLYSSVEHETRTANKFQQHIKVLCSSLLDVYNSLCYNSQRETSSYANEQHCAI